MKSGVEKKIEVRKNITHGLLYFFSALALMGCLTSSKSGEPSDSIAEESDSQPAIHNDNTDDGKSLEILAEEPDRPSIQEPENPAADVDDTESGGQQSEDTSEDSTQSGSEDQGSGGSDDSGNGSQSGGDSSGSGGTTSPPPDVTDTRSPPYCAYPQNLGYGDNTIMPNHRSQALLDQDVIQAYEDWKFSFLKTEVNSADASKPNYRVSFGHNDPSRTVSEGQGYGMIFAAYMAGSDPQAQEIFNGLWRFAEDHPSENDARLMAWIVPEPYQGGASAFDGDIDIAWALILADAQWGSSGEIDYRSAALEKIAAIAESTIGPDSHLPMLGDWVTPSGVTYNQYVSRSSDFMPQYFRAFHRFLTQQQVANADLWLQVITASQFAIDRIQANYSSTAGLLPDFLRSSTNRVDTLQPAYANFLESNYDGDYFYNAGRVPLRIGVDSLINGDGRSVVQTRKLANWFAGQIGGNAYALKSGYRLDGAVIGHYFSSFFAAPVAVAMMSEPSAQSSLNALYNAIYTNRQNYYEDSISLLSLLVLSGNYWDPTVQQCTE